MLFRGLYHFNSAHSQQKASDPIAYFTAPENADARDCQNYPQIQAKTTIVSVSLPLLDNALQSLSCNQWVVPGNACRKRGGASCQEGVHFNFANRPKNGP